VANPVTVYTGAPLVSSCPTSASPPKDVEAVELREVFGPWGASPWYGTTTVWDGQPSWITQYDVDGPLTPCPTASNATLACPSDSAANEAITTTLALPWLNATIVVRGATGVRTQELLSHVTVHAQSAVAVPTAASQMSVIWATTNQHAQSSTSPSDIEQTLSALRALPSLPASAACEITANVATAEAGKVVTFESDSTETSFLVAQSPCNQVSTGTGAASQADAALGAALARVPLPPMS
jgi:hypothetical protein